MNDQHRATAEQWKEVKDHNYLAFSCLLELRDRIKALEAAQHAHVDLSHLSDAERERMLKSIANPGRFEALEATQPEHLIDPEREKMAQEFMQAAGFAPRSSEGELRAAAQPAKSNHPAKPDSSLVQRVANALDGGTEWQARQATREVAAWMRDQRPWDAGLWPSLLEQEAER